MYKKPEYQSINEQKAVISDDMNDRLKGYLDNEDFLEKLSAIFRDLDDGENTTLVELQVSGKEYGVLDNDVIHIKVDKSDINHPKFYVWIMNDEFVFSDVDIDLAARYLNSAGKGIGTNEEQLVGVSGALALAASEKNIDPKIYFDKLAKVYAENYGESIIDYIEGEFSGRAEAVALNTFRQGIPSSTMRGVDITSILIDLGLTLATFGVGTAASASIKGIGASARVATKVAKPAATLIKAGSKSLTGIKGVISRIPGFSKLGKATQIAEIGKKVKIGSKIPYKSGSKMVDHKVINISESGIRLKNLNAGNSFTVNSPDFVLSVNPGIANRILDGANINATTAALALATKKAGNVADAIGNNPETSFGGKAMEVMGWYDTLTADPSSFVADVKSQDYKALAGFIYDLKEGSGLFGNTTNQDELAMALIVTSLTPEAAMLIKTEYERIDMGTSVYSVLDDELGGDMGLFAKSWWAACTKEGLENHSEIVKFRDQFKKVEK